MMRRMLLGVALAVGLSGAARAQTEVALTDFIAGFVRDFEDLDWARFRALLR